MRRRVCGSSLGWKQQAFMNPICNCAPSVLQQNSHLLKFCFRDDKYLSVPHRYSQSLDLLKVISFSSFAAKVQRIPFLH